MKILVWICCLVIGNGIGATMALFYTNLLDRTKDAIRWSDLPKGQIEHDPEAWKRNHIPLTTPPSGR